MAVESLPPRGGQLMSHFETELRRQLLIPRDPNALALIVPAHNEEPVIRRALRAALANAAFAVAQGMDVTVVVVDNNSTDRTSLVAREWNEAARRELGARLRIKLAHEPRPGKVNALMKLKDVLPTPRPEWIAQMDADASLPREDTVYRLTERAAQKRQVAASGELQCYAPPGETLIWMHEEIADAPYPEGSSIELRWPKILWGQFMTVHSPAFFAGYGAIQSKFPDALNDDTVLSAMFRLAGFDIGIGSDNPDIPFYVLGDWKGREKEALDRWTRWGAGHLQMMEVFGRPKLEEIEHLHVLFHPDQREHHMLSGRHPQWAAFMRKVQRRYEVAGSQAHWSTNRPGSL